MAFLESRRRMLARKGRPMLLSRPNVASPPADVTVQGFLYPWAPALITGPVIQGDAHVEILNDEIAAAAWPGPPGATDYLIVDGFTWVIVGAQPLYEAATLIGFSLWVRGGQP